MNIIETIKDRIQGKAPKGAKRDSRWSRVRKHYLLLHPNCALCGSKKNNRVHHKIPFHIAPELELDARNLITLCETKKYGINCHLFFGHLGNFRRVNTTVEADIAAWHIRLNTGDFALYDDHETV